MKHRHGGHPSTLHYHRWIMSRLSTLQSVLGLRFIAAATLPLLLFGWFAYQYMVKHQLDEAGARLYKQTLNIRNETSDFLGQAESDLLMSRSLIERLQAAAPADVEVFLQAVADQSRHFDAIYRMDENMRVRSVSLPAKLAAQRRSYLDDLSRVGPQFDRHRLPALPVAEDATAIVWFDPFVSVATGKLSVMSMAKLPDGYLLGTVALDQLSVYLDRRASLSENKAFAIIDRHGKLMVNSTQQPALEPPNYLAHPEVQAALSSGKEVATKFHEDQKLLESALVIPRCGWVVYASMSREGALLGAYQLRVILISTLLIAVVFGGGLAFWQSRQVVRPLLTLRDSTQGVTRGDYQGLERLGNNSFVELNDLSANFLEMGAAVMERETFLRASEERFRSLITGMGEGLLIIDRAGKITDCNEAAERILCLSRSELLGQSILAEQWRAIHEDGTPCPPDEYPASITLRTSAKVDNQVVGLCLHDGREIWLQVNSRPQWSLHGEVNAAVVTFADVTRLKVAEASLRIGKLRYQELFQQFSVLLEGITDRIDLLMPDMQVAWSNRESAGPQRPGGGPSDDNRCFVCRFGRTEPCQNCPAVRCFASGRREVGEVVDRQGLTWSLRAFPVKSEAVVIQVVLIAEDITEELEGERQRSRASQLAALGELAAGVAHEINNPISGVINYAQLICNRAAEGSREHDLAKRIIKEGDRIATIVRELLIFAHEESSDRKVVSIREALAEALLLCESQLRKEAVDLQIDLPPDLPRVESRSHQIQQLFLNLISNSRHALAEKYPEPHANKILLINGRQVELEGRPFVRLKVRDHGTGIPPEMLERVMTPFVTTKPAGIGTGLGLSISFEIAKKHDGLLSIASEQGAWTEVTVDLPACTSTAHG
ncbi:MAG: ATP-binding protein [Desulfuromonadales bacterium]|nr:ATP-binding protein [Desulfuromonadales bacterium]